MAEETAHRNPLQTIQGMGAVLVNATLYGLYHGITVKSLESCFEHLQQVLREASALTLSMLPDGQWMANGVPVETRNQFAVRCETTLRHLEIAGLMIQSGIPETEFVEFMTWLVESATTPGREKTAVTELASGRFPHVGIKRSVYREIAEDEIVVAQGAAGGTANAPGEPPAVEAPDVPEPPALDAIMLFLRGAGDAQPPAALRDIETAAGQPDTLADAIMQAVEVKPGRLDLAGGETLGELLVGCLRRTADAIMQDPAIKTQKGKQTVRKSLAVIEEDLVNRLREMGDVGHERAAEQVADASAELREDLQVETAISQYMKRRKALEASEARIMSMMQRTSSERLRSLGVEEKFTAEGLSANGWRQLVIKSGAEPTGDGGGADGGILALLLANLTEAIEKQAADQAASSQLDATIRDIEAEVSRVSTDAEARIDALTESVRRDQAARRKRGEPAKQDDELIKTLAEINQELCQPLAVLNCSIDMLHGGRLGELNENQKHTLTLASDSGRRLQLLVDKLAHISGLPEELRPDSSVLSQLYHSGNHAR